MKRRIIRFELLRLAEADFGLVQPAKTQEDLPQVANCASVVRLGLQNTPEAGFGLVQEPLVL